MRLVLATGGTAGHIYPAIAVAEAALLRGSIEVIVAGAAGGPEELIARRSDLEWKRLAGAPWQRQGAGGRVRAVAGAARGILQARRFLREWEATAVVGFGAYASFASVAAAQTLGIWNAIVEPNVDAGFANRILGRRADSVFAARYTNVPSAWTAKTHRTGVPVRAEVIRAAGDPRALHSPRRILVLGGIADGEFIDREVPRVIRCVAETVEVSVTHQSIISTGDALREAYGSVPVRPVAYIDAIVDAYASADFVIARAGASTLAELSTMGLPALIVPLPAASEDHQGRNAEVHAQTGSAILADERTWNARSVASRMTAALGEPEWRSMSDRARSLAVDSSADAILDLVESGVASVRRSMSERRAAAEADDGPAELIRSLRH